MQPCLEMIPDDIRRVYLAFSGGLDSSVLLHLLTSKACEFEIVLWHFNHGLLDVANQMEKFCMQQANHYGLGIRVDQLKLSNQKGNIEAEARRQRYQLFEQHAHAGDCVMTAHHADDQAETFVLNALRGSGSAGLRGIARKRMLGDALLLRPLLSCSRSELEAYAERQGLSWFEDPSNQSNRFDRNFLRNEVMPIIASRWPNFQVSFSTASELQFETQQLLDEIAAIDYSKLKAAESGGNATLELDGLLELSMARCKNLVRYWIAMAGLTAIPRARLQELLNQLHAKADAMPEITMPGYSIRLYHKRLFLLLVNKSGSRSGEFGFALKKQVEIKQFGIRVKRQQIFRNLGIDDQGQKLTLRFRDNAQKNSDRHRLKRLFQKHRVPPWERSTIAQVYLDGKLKGLLL